ncbi:helix-turn-helix domain-containing protein [Halobacillus litoralis]|uniref:XRE family transcriptional regulator n=1 Tax=Halobacillus litoralis TaxID=45668 RepID=A0A410MCJ4_9BACI|nr:helix-turn-helix transcriptional regulator [Halobacillus litoralis]QAS52420.1 XRE family transcriptional regulator [Halobacillus litoralis]
MTNFGDILRKLRKEHKLSQRELGEKVQISESSVSMYERNEREPSFEITNKFADFFDVSSDYLLGRTHSREPEDFSEEEIEGFFGFDLDSLNETEVKELKAQLRKEVEFYLWQKKKNK